MNSIQRITKGTVIDGVQDSSRKTRPTLVLTDLSQVDCWEYAHPVWCMQFFVDCYNRYCIPVAKPSPRDDMGGGALVDGYRISYLYPMEIIKVPMTRVYSDTTSIAGILPPNLVELALAISSAYLMSDAEKLSVLADKVREIQLKFIAEYDIGYIEWKLKNGRVCRLEESGAYQVYENGTLVETLPSKPGLDVDLDMRKLWPKNRSVATVSTENLKKLLSWQNMYPEYAVSAASSVLVGTVLNRYHAAEEELQRRGE